MSICQICPAEAKELATSRIYVDGRIGRRRVPRPGARIAYLEGSAGFWL